ncbi:hypothetical protein RD792_003522 [Penstemon davidsonii]|uniref:Uncharacterized protein n=1 Tax=Penstemon davidsonii TaxID=160366 RepID=A0ABR0DTZ0_9LAMI|nr:hypothetical protein RD792_003522 [Penstemon davidsonii]
MTHIGDGMLLKFIIVYDLVLRLEMLGRIRCMGVPNVLTSKRRTQESHNKLVHDPQGGEDEDLNSVVEGRRDVQEHDLLRAVEIPNQRAKPGPVRKKAKGLLMKVNVTSIGAGRITKPRPDSKGYEYYCDLYQGRLGKYVKHKGTGANFEPIGSSRQRSRSPTRRYDNNAQLIDSGNQGVIGTRQVGFGTTDMLYREALDEMNLGHPKLEGVSTPLGFPTRFLMRHVQCTWPDPGITSPSFTYAYAREVLGTDEEYFVASKTGNTTLLGIIRDHLSIDCNDEGVPFIVGRVKKLQLSDFLEKPDMGLIKKFVPVDLNWNANAPGENVSRVVCIHFECGGMALFVILSHIVADATTLKTFLNFWAAIARGDDGCSNSFSPDFMTKSLVFPYQDPNIPRDSNLFMDIGMAKFLKTGKYEVRRYVFNAGAISQLKVRSISPNLKYVSSVGVVTAFIWKCFIASFEATIRIHDYQSSVLIQQVNMRKRALPRFSDNLLEISYGQVLQLLKART